MSEKIGIYKTKDGIESRMNSESNKGLETVPLIFGLVFGLLLGFFINEALSLYQEISRMKEMRREYGEYNRENGNWQWVEKVELKEK